MCSIFLPDTQIVVIGKYLPPTSTESYFRYHISVVSKIACFSRAADWNLAEPQWTGRMRLISKGSELAIKLEDKNTGELFAKCPIEAYPGVAIESVTDSSRYFVLRIQDDNGEFY